MSLPGIIFGAVLLTLTGSGSRLAAADSDPAALWVSAYAWLQTGEKLAAAEQWPLASGSYIEALQKFTALHETHPTYEVELVEYRLAALHESLAALESHLTESDHDVMMKYLDFIESFEQGQNARYANQLDDASSTLHIAQTLLDELTAEKPASFRAAMDSQVQMLESSITWVESQISYSRRKQVVIASSDVDLGTTRFVTAADLPADGGSTLLASALFPTFTMGAISKPAPPPPPPPAEPTPLAEPTPPQAPVSPAIIPKVASPPPALDPPAPAATQGVLIRGFRMSSTTEAIKADLTPTLDPEFTEPGSTAQ
jgi:hypothetical protein